MGDHGASGSGSKHPNYSRKKLNLTWIANDGARRITLKKRIKGLIKKIREILILCNGLSPKDFEDLLTIVEAKAQILWAAVDAMKYNQSQETLQLPQQQPDPPPPPPVVAEAAEAREKGKSVVVDDNDYTAA
ncbi:hypothetical protein QJS10_CPB04g01129 [Acorus calamus]|uniref:MADS-box domain-containing protein n=1 Tax=Acorus calamus TaxID=4465 RepID=A0AAV9EYY3_ACOCL|nr:hypothetical protein QJS10_CPB04g01129 [Acorus calamus]